MKKSTLWPLMLVAVFGLLVGCGSDQTGKMAQGGADTTAIVGETPEVGAGTAETPAEHTATPPATQTEPKSQAVTKPAAKPPVKPAAVTVQLPESTAIVISLVDSIDTDIHVAGDRFTAQLAAPLMVDGRTCFETGAHVVGILDSVIESGRLDQPAELGFHIVSIADAQGNPVLISTSMIYEKKGGKTGRDAALIGGGAVVGGIIGKITGKKGGTEIGAVAGAAAGAATAAATGKDDIVHSAGTQLTFYLAEPLSVTLAK
jgi:hypothetical protein